MAQPYPPSPPRRKPEPAFFIALLVPRRQQRRPAFRPTKGGRSLRTEDTGALDAGARRVLIALGADPHRLAALVHDLRQVRDTADRQAFDEPSPGALREYRRAARELAEAERALVLAGGG